MPFRPIRCISFVCLMVSSDVRTSTKSPWLGIWGLLGYPVVGRSSPHGAEGSGCDPDVGDWLRESSGSMLLSRGKILRNVIRVSGKGGLSSLSLRKTEWRVMAGKCRLWKLNMLIDMWQSEVLWPPIYAQAIHKEHTTSALSHLRVARGLHSRADIDNQ